MAGSTQTTSLLSQEVSTYYEKRFLDRAENYLVMKEGGQMRSHPGGEGKTVRFTRYTPLTVSTTALTEANTPAITDLTATNVDAVISEFGNSIKVGRFLSTVSIDERDAEKVDVVSENMGRTLDQITRDELENGTVQFAGAKSLISDVAASDVLSSSELRKAVRTLETNGAPKYEGVGEWIAKIQPYQKYDFTGDTTWVNAATYSNVSALYKGEMGMLYGIRLLLTNAGKTTSSTVTVYHAYVHGKNAFGCVELAGDPPKLYIVPNTAVDSGNPAARFGFISWAGTYVTKVLNSNFIVVLKTGATA